MDPFIVFGLRVGSSLKEIKTKYKELALQFHPDKNNSSEAKERMQLINQAKEMLLGEEKEDTKAKKKPKIPNCEDCGRLFENWSSRSIHVRFFHLNNDKKPKCPGCRNVLSCPRSLERHQLSCRGEHII